MGTVIALGAYCALGATENTALTLAGKLAFSQRLPTEDEIVESVKVGCVLGPPITWGLRRVIRLGGVSTG